jgi:hypothetical protein
MAMEDMMGILTIAPAILGELPLIMFLLYVSFVVSFSLFLGFIAMRGIRERWYMNYWMKLGLRFGTGLLCFLIGLSIAELIPQLTTNPLIVTFQTYAGIFLGGLAASLLIMIGLWFATHHVFNIGAMKAYIKRLEERLKHAEEIHKEEAKKPKIQRILNPVRVCGIIIIAALIVLTVIYFPGFPDPYQDALAAIGIEREDLDNLIEQMGGNMDMPEGCENILILIQANSDDLMNNRLPQTTDANAQRLVSGEGHTVLAMYEITHNGDYYILAVTSDTYMCHIREGELCGCLDVSSFVTTT